MSAPVRLAVLGDPLRYTRSPELHRAAAEALGLACESVALRTAPGALAATLERLELEGYRGCNLTMPLKEPALGCVREATPAARRARSVNTVTFRAQGMHGDTTDGAGFIDLLVSLGREPAHVRTLLLGAGGSARSLAVALHDAGSTTLEFVSRHEPEAEAAWRGARWHAWESVAAREALSHADVVVNCTPLAGDVAPAAAAALARGALVIDLAYAEWLTPWVIAARAHGCEAFDGLGLLVYQARHSLSHWFGQEVPLEPLAAAVGWPR